MQARGVILFTAFSAAALALLVGLGLWQLQRLEWKQGLIAQIEQRAHAEPISLADGIARTNAGEDVSYLRVRVEGRFDNAKERYLYALSDGTPGWHVITPLTTSEGQVVLIDRGFVPNAFKEPSSRTQGEINDTVTVTGLARQPETRGLFVSDNEPAENRWFWRDLGAIFRSMFEGATAPAIAPFILEAERSDVPGGWPLGGQTKLDLPNKHLQYALTWFLLALCLVVIYVVYVRSRLRAA
jgi:surfeit locus 1 family protein